MSDKDQKIETAEEKPEKRSFLKRISSGPRKLWTPVWEFSKELWNDHQFWVNTIAVKGGAAAILAGAAVGISFAFTFPFLVAAGIVLLCGAAIAVGTLGIISGSSKIWEKLKDTWYKATGKERPPAPTEKVKSLLDKLHEKPSVQKILKHKWSQKFFASRTWHTMKKIKDKQDAFLGGLAVSSSVASTIVGVWVLAVQVVALPVIAIPTLLTGAIVVGAGYLASSLVGLWISTENIIQRRREKRAKEKAEKAAKACMHIVHMADAPLAETSALQGKTLAADFQTANDNTKLASPVTTTEVAAPVEKNAPPPKL